MQIRPSYHPAGFSDLGCGVSPHGHSSIVQLSPLNQISYDYTVEVTNRFKGLDLIERVPDELWMEVCDTVQEPGIKTISKKKKCKKGKWLSEEALKIAVKRSDKKKEKE